MDIVKQLRESCFCEGRGCELCCAAAEITQLRTEKEDLRNGGSMKTELDSAWESAIHNAERARKAEAEIERLQAELAECKQDAERYRWLRHPRMGWDIVHKTEVGLVCAEYLACVELDAAIDAARKGEGEVC